MTDKQVLAISNIIHEEIDAAMNVIKHRIADTFSSTSSEATSEKMKPLHVYQYGVHRWMGYCPTCSWNDGTILQPVTYPSNYCSNCGQPLDWSDIEDIIVKERIRDGSQSNISTREISENYPTGHQR